MVKMSLFINIYDGSSFEIPYNQNFTVNQVKLRLKALTGTQVGQLILVYNGRELLDHLTLFDAEVPKDSKVFIIYYIYVFFR
jgi:hypothetical protein